MLIGDEVVIGLDYDPVDLAWPEACAACRDVSRRLEMAGLLPKHLVHAWSGTVMASFILLGPYVVPVAQIVVPRLWMILVAWMKAPGRRVRVKVGDLVIEATSVEDVERLLPQLREFQSEAARKKPVS